MSESPQHTPGPWKVGTDTANNAQGYGSYLWSLHIFACNGNEEDEDTNICWCSSQGDGAQDGDNAPKLSVARANARLIAAAPDLLGALKLCVNRLALHAAHGNLDVVDAVDAAIAKAESRA